MPDCRARPKLGALIHVGRAMHNRVVHSQLPGYSVSLTAGDLDLRCRAEDVSRPSRQLRQRLVEERGVDVQLNRLVSVRRYGYCGLAVRRALGQFGESLPI